MIPGDADEAWAEKTFPHFLSERRRWPYPVSDKDAIIFALSTIASWETWCETGGPSLEVAANLILLRLEEAREAREGTA